MSIEAIKLRAAVAEWFNEDAVCRAYAEATRRSYRRSMNALIQVTSSQLRVYELKTEHFDAALKWLSTPADEQEAAMRARLGWAPRGRRSAAVLGTDVKAFKAFLKFCWRRNYLSYSQNPVGHMKSNPGKRGASAPLQQMIVQPTQEVLDRLLEKAGERHPRDRMAVALGLYAGLRESELLELRISGVDLDAAEVRVWRQKTQSWHVVPMHPRLHEEARQYFEWLRGFCTPEPDHYALAARRAGVSRVRRDGHFLPSLGRLTPNTPLEMTAKAHAVAEDIVAAFKNANFPKLYRPGSHTLRRMAAVYIVEATGNRENAQTLLGHEHGNTTDIYLRHADKTERLRAAMRKLAPAAATGGFGATDDCDVCEPEAPSNVIQLRPRRKTA